MFFHGSLYDHTDIGGQSVSQRDGTVFGVLAVSSFPMQRSTDVVSPLSLFSALSQCHAQNIPMKAMCDYVGFCTILCR